MRIGPSVRGANDVRADFEEPAGIVGADARCFGGDGLTATVTVNLMTADGGQMTLTQDIVCDTEPHRIGVGDPAAKAVSATGTAPATTFLYVTTITAP